MRPRIAVMGAGIAGLSTALLLARRGIPVTVLERDGAPPPRLGEIGDWNRPGAAQMRQLHTFLGLFRKNLSHHLPDVYQDLLANGAEEISVTAEDAADPELAVLASRRPVVEWALYRALLKEPDIELRYGTSVRRPDIQRGRLCGVHIRGGIVETDLLIDAGGRRSPLLDDFTVLEQEVDCGVVYNTRFYRLLDGVPRPPLDQGVTTMIGGAGFGAGLFYHDNRTFAIGLGRLPDDNSLKGLRESEGFEQVTRLFPEFGPWLRPDVSEVLTEVVPMAGLRNALRGLAPDAPAGYLMLGDALCTTDPAFGRGASVAMAQAVRLAEALAEAPDDPAALAPELTAESREWVRPWFEDSVQADVGRTRLWEAVVSGAAIPATGGVPSANLFSVMEAGRQDPVLWQAAQRVANLLAPMDSLDTPEIRQRLSALWNSGWRPAPPTGPSYATVVEAVSAPMHS